MIDRLKWRLVLAALAAYILIPLLITPLLAQRQGNELGRAVLPCLCCFDIRFPEVNLIGGTIACILVIVFIAFVKYAEISEKRRKQAKEEKQRQDQEEATRLYGWWIGKTVWFMNGSVREYGVVMKQQADTHHKQVVSFR